MFRKIITISFLTLFSLTYGGYAEDFTLKYYSYTGYLSPEKCLYVLDNGRHFPNEFRPVLNEICLGHPKYNKTEVTNLMISAYQAIQKSQPDITIFEVAKGMRRFSEDILGIDLTTCVAAYVRSQAK